LSRTEQINLQINPGRTYLIILVIPNLMMNDDDFEIADASIQRSAKHLNDDESILEKVE